MAPDSQRAVRGMWRRPGLAEAVLDALRVLGNDRDVLTVDDLAPLDQFHNGGTEATRTLARLLDPRPGTQALDVGGGLGGPARLLAVEFGCAVTVLDVTEDYLRAGALLTAQLGVQRNVQFALGTALALPFPDTSFDVVWTQNSGMNIDDKATLYTEFHRVLRPGGRLATQEPVAGPVQPPYFPLMWAPDAASSFLISASALRTLIRASGFREHIWEERRPQPAPRPTDEAGALPVTIQRLVMGDQLPAIQAAGARNVQEGRLAGIQAVFERT